MEEACTNFSSVYLTEEKEETMKGNGQTISSELKRHKIDDSKHWTGEYLSSEISTVEEDSSAETPHKELGLWSSSVANPQKVHR